MFNRKTVAVLAGAIFFLSAVHAQVQNPGIQQSGAVTANHCMKWGPGVGQASDAGQNCLTGSASALTEVNDTNVTLTLTGTPATALLQAVQIQAGWNGSLAVGRGGTGGASASGTLLDNITGFASTGLLSRTGAGAYSFTTPAAFTEVNDTNVTLTLTGTPATALLQAVQIQAGWNGSLAVGRGGTGAATQSGAAINIFPTPTRAGDLAWWNGTNWVTLAGNNSGTQVLTENSSGTPAWAPGAGTVTEQKNTASGGLTTSGNCDNTTTNAGSPCNYLLAAPYFQANLNASAQTVTTNTLTVVAFDNILFQTTGTGYNATTHTMTPTLAGTYRVQSHLTCGGTTISVCDAQIFKNGSSYARGVGVPISGAFASVEVDALVQFNGSTDSATIEVNNTCTGTCTVSNGNGPILSWFSATYISP